MKRLLRITAIALVVLTLFGCAVKEQTEAPAQSASGGNANAAEHINLKDVNITADADETVVTLSLLSGSRNSDYPESRLLSLPGYSVVQLASPQRIMITLQNISYCDYEEKESWALSDFLRGVFQESPADNGSVILYLQLSRSAQFTVEESEGDLIIRLKPAEAQNSSRFYCVSNSFFEHQEGTWPKDIDMTPILCSDLENKLLISPPFETQQAAESYRDSINEELQNVLPGNSLNVVELAPGALPDYTAIDYSIAEVKKILSVQDLPVSVPLLLQNGKYLATAPSGLIAFSRIYRPEEPALEQNAYLNSEKLWLLEPDGRVQSVNIPEFYMIDSVQFSADSRYLCLLDVSIENRVLYVYDTMTSTLLNLGEEGFGNQTAAFAWSDTENKLYAMTGYDGALQMLSCTFAEGGGVDIEAVEEEAGAGGHLGVSQGRLFFADNYAGVIYEIGDSRTEIAKGIDFRISPDGKSMVVLETNVVENEQVLTNLKLYDIVTGEYKIIREQAEIESFGFSSDGSKVIYTSEENGAQNAFPYGLYVYDIASGESVQLALCSTGDVEVGNEGAIYLIEYFDDAKNGFYASYQYDLGI